MIYTTIHQCTKHQGAYYRYILDNHLPGEIVVISLSICRLFLSSMQPALLHKRPPQKNHTRKHPNKYDIPSTYTCRICQKSFHYEGNYRKHLTTHQPTAAAVPSAEPEETVHDLHNSLAYPADLVASLPEDCCQCYIENCSQICSCQHSAQLTQVYNQRLETDSDIGDMLQAIFCAQKNAFKINMSFGSILSNI